MAEEKLAVEILDGEGKVLPDPSEVTKEPESEVRQVDNELAEQLKALQDKAEAESRKAYELESQLNEVVRFAQNTVEENKRLAGLIHNGEKMLVSQAGGRVKAELEAAEALYKKAYEDGDTVAMIKAQKEIARLTYEDQQVKNYTPVQTQPVQQQAQQPVRQAPPIDDKSKAWVEKNKEWWFKDDPMTGYALGLHKKIVSSGVKPGTDDYVKALDEGMAKAFPDKFQGSDSTPRQKPSGVTVVAPATRSVGGKPSNKVQLSASQAAMARRLGVPIQEYAEQVARLNENG